MDTVKNLCIRYVTAICYGGYSFVMCGIFCSFAVNDICMTLGAPQTKFCTHWLTRLALGQSREADRHESGCKLRKNFHPISVASLA